MRLRSLLTGRKGPELPPLAPAPAVSDLPEARLQSPARYVGTLDEDGGRVTALGLGPRSRSRLHLSTAALDVVRMAGSFRIPAAALRGATTTERFGGVEATNLLVVRWSHAGREWRTGFALEAGSTLRAGSTAPDLQRWVRTISKMSRTTPEAQQ